MKTSKRHNLEYFLSELGRLSRETGITIHGCGCCGSPWLEGVPKEKEPQGYWDRAEVRDNLAWDRDEKIYTVDKE